MNEYAFIKSCIKVAGLTVLLLGIMGLVLNGLFAAINYIQAAMPMTGSYSAETYQFARDGLRKVATTAAIRMPGNIIQIFVGLFLCRRYQRPLNWLMKE